MTVVDLLREMLRQGASDLHITTGVPPILRVHGDLVQLGSGAITPPEAEQLVEELISLSDRSDSHWGELNRRGQADFSVSVAGTGRFRVNCYLQRGNCAAAVRAIPFAVPRFEDLGLPESVRSLTDLEQGLVLVCGATGSGKSTTLAALIDIINRTHRKHILTIEDPVEFLHQHQLSIVNQREIGSDAPSFAEALRAALRQDPDVILVGEMRDFETIQIAITAAETGHLVFATLHSQDAAGAVDRIIDSYPPSQHRQIALQLSLVLQGVVAQRLLPRADRKGRVCVCEVMIPNAAIRSNIKDQHTDKLYHTIQTSQSDGQMQTMNYSLAERYAKGLITAEEMWRNATKDSREEIFGYLRTVHGIANPPDPDLLLSRAGAPAHGAWAGAGTAPSGAAGAAGVQPETAQPLADRPRFRSSLSTSAGMSGARF